VTIATLNLRADATAAAPLRAGIIGLDTSHVPAFAACFNDPEARGDLAGIRVVAGYPGGTDLPLSRDRVAKFTADLQATGVEIVDSIPALLAKVDVVVLASADGRIHLAQAVPVILAGKPLFVDKPVAGSLAEAITIFDLARKHAVPCFSSSALRFDPGLRGLRQNAQLGPIMGAVTWGPCSYLDGVPDLFFYGLHGIEPLFMLMGTGCETVTRIQTKETELVSGIWPDGRIGTYRGLRSGPAEFGAMAFGATAILSAARTGMYEELAREIGRFFKTGTPPVAAEETLEIYAFMVAADESKRQGGAPVALASVMAKARAQAQSAGIARCAPH
jgi:hypothetical protein